jgi:16S rRNA processing protein RimM
VEQTSWATADIVGFEVIDEQHGSLGTLMDVLPTGANDVLVVKPPREGAQEYMVPALKSVVKTVDLVGKKIFVVLPAGLKELYEEL